MTHFNDAYEMSCERFSLLKTPSSLVKYPFRPNGARGELLGLACFALTRTDLKKYTRNY